MRGRIPQLQGQALAQAACHSNVIVPSAFKFAPSGRAGGRARKLPVSPALVTSASTARNCPSFALMRGAGAAAASATGCVVLLDSPPQSAAGHRAAGGGALTRPAGTGRCSHATLLQSCVSRARTHGRARRRPQHSPLATARHAASNATKLRRRGIMCAASGTEAGLQGAAHDTLGGWPVPNQELLHWGHQPTKALPGRGTQPSTLGRPHCPTIGGPAHLRPKAKGVLRAGSNAGADFIVWGGCRSRLAGRTGRYTDIHLRKYLSEIWEIRGVPPASPAEAMAQLAIVFLALQSLNRGTGRSCCTG